MFLKEKYLRVLNSLKSLNVPIAPYEFRPGDRSRNYWKFPDSVFVFGVLRNWESLHWVGTWRGIEKVSESYWTFKFKISIHFFSDHWCSAKFSEHLGSVHKLRRQFIQLFKTSDVKHSKKNATLIPSVRPHPILNIPPLPYTLYPAPHARLHIHGMKRLCLVSCLLETFWCCQLQIASNSFQFWN